MTGGSPPGGPPVVALVGSSRGAGRGAWGVWGSLGEQKRSGPDPRLDIFCSPPTHGRPQRPGGPARLARMGSAWLAGYRSGPVRLAGNGPRTLPTGRALVKSFYTAETCQIGTFNAYLNPPSPHRVWIEKPQVKSSKVCSHGSVSTGSSTVVHTASRRVPQPLHRVIHRAVCWG